MNSDFNVAIHALVYLDHKACSLSSEELADNICTNPARVRKVMSNLKKQGLVASTEGAQGGYAMTRTAEGIALDEVARAVGGKFVYSTWMSGDSDKECLVSSGMAGVMDDLYAELDEVCRRTLHDKTIAGIERRIFGEGASEKEKVS